MKLEEKLSTLAEAVASEGEAPTHIPSSIERRVRMRRIGLALLVPTVALFGAVGAVMLVNQALPRDRGISPAQSPGLPTTVASFEIGGVVDSLIVSRDPETDTLFLYSRTDYARLGEAADNWKIAPIPLNDDLEAKFAVDSGYTEEAVFGAVSGRVADVEVRLDDGRLYKAQFFSLPGQLGIAGRVFTVKYEQPLTSGSVVALSQDGEVLETQEFPPPGKPQPIEDSGND